MFQISLFEVLTKGTLKDFLNVSIQAIVDRNGNPDDIEVYNSTNGVFYHYENIRIGFSEGISNEVVVYFYKRPYENIFECGNELIRISDNYLMNQMLGLLKKLNVEWIEVKAEAGPDYVTIGIHNCVKILYYSENRKLDRITVAGFSVKNV